jgi:hypothetical protein
MSAEAHPTSCMMDIIGFVLSGETVGAHIYTAKVKNA